MVQIQLKNSGNIFVSRVSHFFSAFLVLTVENISIEKFVKSQLTLRMNLHHVFSQVLMDLFQGENTAAFSRAKK